MGCTLYKILQQWLQWAQAHCTRHMTVVLRSCGYRHSPTKKLAGFCVSISTSWNQGLCLFLCQDGPLMFTDDILVPLRRALSTERLNCGYCFQLCSMRDYECWALWALCCSWVETVLSCEARDIKGHRCKSWTLCLWLSFQTLWKQEGVSVCVFISLGTFGVCMSLGEMGPDPRWVN